MPKVKDGQRVESPKGTKKPAPPPAPPRSYGPGPKLPSICSESEMDLIAKTIADLYADGITLRKLRSAVDYFIDRQQWQEGAAP